MLSGGTKTFTPGPLPSIHLPASTPNHLCPILSFFFTNPCPPSQATQHYPRVCIYSNLYHFSFHTVDGQALYLKLCLLGGFVKGVSYSHRCALRKGASTALLHDGGPGPPARAAYLYPLVLLIIHPRDTPSVLGWTAPGHPQPYVLVGLTDPACFGQSWTPGHFLSYGRVFHLSQGPVAQQDFFFKKHLLLCRRWCGLAADPPGAS